MAEEQQDVNNSCKEGYGEVCMQEEQSLETQDADPPLEPQEEPEVQNAGPTDANYGREQRVGGHGLDLAVQDAGNFKAQRLLDLSAAALAAANLEQQQPDANTRQTVPQGTKAVAVCSNKNLTSKYRGVCWNKKNKRWQAAINAGGRYLYLGSYNTEEEAARMFDKAAVRIRGEKAKLNYSFSDYMDDNGMYVQDPDVESLLVDADPNCRGSRRGRQRGRQDDDELEPASSPEHTSKQPKHAAQSQPLVVNPQTRQLTSSKPGTKPLPNSSLPAVAPAKQPRITHPVQSVFVQRQGGACSSDITEPSMLTNRQTAAYTPAVGEGAYQNNVSFTRVIVPQLQQPVLIKSSQGELQLPQQVVLQTESGKTITALSLPANFAGIDSNTLLQHLDDIDRQRTIQALQLQQAAAVQAARNRQQQQDAQQLHQLQKLQMQQQQWLVLQRDQQQNAAMHLNNQLQQPKQEVKQLQSQLEYKQCQDGTASTSSTQALASPANSTAQGPVTLNSIFQAIGQQLPEGGTLDCVIPCATENTLGVLFSLSGSTRVGAGLWNGKVFRSLGSYGSDKDAKQACQSALQLIKDLEPGTVFKQEPKQADKNSRQDSLPPPRTTVPLAQPLQLQLVQPGARVLPSHALSLLQPAVDHVQGQKPRHQPYQILLPSGVQLMPVNLDNIVAALPSHLDARIVTDGQGGYRLEQVLTQQRQVKVAEANEASLGSLKDEPVAKRQRVAQM